MQSAEFLRDMYAKFNVTAPDLHCVLGSGLSDALSEFKLSSQWTDSGEIKFSEIPDFVVPSASGHPGVYKIFKHQSKRVLCMQLGRLHGYEGLKPSQVVKSVTQIYDAGTKNFLLSNAAGSLKAEYKPGSVMLMEDHVNFTGKNPLIGKNTPSHAPRFPDLSSCYCKEMNNLLESTLKENFNVHRGTYIGVLGPSYETPAEIQLFSSWNMGAVGMSTVWESIALKHRGARLAGLSFLSNYGCGLVENKPLTHEDVLLQGNTAATKLLEGFFNFSEGFFHAL